VQAPRQIEQEHQNLMQADDHEEADDEGQQRARGRHAEHLTVPGWRQPHAGLLRDPQGEPAGVGPDELRGIDPVGGRRLELGPQIGGEGRAVAPVDAERAPLAVGRGEQMVNDRRRRAHGRLLDSVDGRRESR
jgi:hypothetical protein